jgi:hypothetical protein
LLGQARRVGKSADQQAQEYGSFVHDEYSMTALIESHPLYGEVPISTSVRSWRLTLGMGTHSMD